MVALEIIKSLFGSIWNLFTGVPIPGLGVSCATMLLAVLIIRISITIFHAAFGLFECHGVVIIGIHCEII